MFANRIRKILLLVVMVIGVVLTAACGPTGTEPAPPPENAQESEADAPAEQADDRTSEDESSSKGKLLIETVPAPSLANNLIGEVTEQEAAIYLPPSYQITNRRFPVVYYLPPVNETPDIWGSRIELVMNALLDKGQVDEMIMVVPSARNALGNTSVWVNSPVTGNWEDYVVENLVPYIDTNYRTLATPASRGIAGNLIGGFGAYNLAMHHPDVFGSVYASGPTLFAPDGLEKSWIPSITNRPRMLALMEEINALTPEAAHERLLEVAAETDTLGGTVSYAMAFVADVEADAPYFEFEYIYLDDETEAPAEVWQRWASGYGAWDAKTASYEENLASLNAIALSYSEADQLYVREGTQYASEQLEAAGIEHELHIREQISTPIREIQDLVMPFFSQNLSFE